MINKIPKNMKKKVFHLLTSGNADIAFYTEAFVTGNKEWVMKRPITFALNLIKININCRIPHRNQTIKGLVPGKKCIARIHRRPKVYQYAMSLMKYQCIFTDVFGSLLEYLIDYDSIYQKIEKEYKLPGFYRLRKRKDNYYDTITNIYDEISNELNALISKDIEINLVKKHVVQNPYVKRAFEIAVYNQTKIVGVIETSYSEEDMKEILGDMSNLFSDLLISSERKLSFHKMRKEYIKTYHSNEIENKEDVFAVVSANYNKALKNSRRYHISPIYYRSTNEIMKSIPLPNLTDEFKNIYQTIAGLELFSGLYNHKNMYETTYLYIAPILYALLERTYQKAKISDGKVIALCDPDCIFAKMYEKYFGEITSCIWSGFVGTNSKSKEEWLKLIEDSYLVQAYSADRLAYALGFSFKQQLLLNCKEEFAIEAYEKAKSNDRKVIREYIRNYIGNEKKLIIVDPMPGLAALNHFREYVYEINPQIEIEEVSMSRYLKKEAKELFILHQILQMDIPYVAGIYKEGSVKEITFVQPRFIDEVKKKTIYGAIDSYLRAFTSCSQSSNNQIIKPADFNVLFEYAKDGLLQLEEVLGGGIE